MLSSAVTSSLGTVQITITDVNDNPPSFVASSLLAAVAEEAEFGTTVTVIQVCMLVMKMQLLIPVSSLSHSHTGH